jgi:hypothetical protein
MSRPRPLPRRGSDAGRPDPAARQALSIVLKFRRLLPKCKDRRNQPLRGTAMPPVPIECETGEAASGLLQARALPACERWIEALLRHVPHAQVALSLPGELGQVVRVYGADTGATPQWDCQIGSDMSLESLLQDLDEPARPAPPGAYAAVPVVVAGRSVGELALSDATRTAWTREELALLGEAAAGMALALTGD